MAKYIYARCSTEAQDYAQQKETISRYLAANHIIEQDITSETVEKISGTVNHTERKLADLIRRCSDGDTIYISELSRLGRNMSDLFAIVTECSNKGISIVQCKDGCTIENKTIGGKAILFALSLAAEIEVQNLRQRVQMGIDVVKNNIRKNGYHESKAGNIITHLGGAKGCDMSAAVEAASVARIQALMDWQAQSRGYQWVLQQHAKGKPRQVIIDEFNELHAAQPDVYCTREGKPLSKGVLSRWLKTANPLAR